MEYLKSLNSFITKTHFLIERPIAHRGLHTPAVKRKSEAPENSKAAFESAIEKNFTIEMDIQLTRDFELIVFHDYFLSRLTQKKGFIVNNDLNYIKTATLYNQENISTLDEVLKLVDGRVPIIIEIKFSMFLKKNIETFCDVLNSKIKNYQGKLAIMSFEIDLMQFLKQKNFLDNYPLGLVTNFPLVETLAASKTNNHIERKILSNQLEFISQNWIGLKNGRIERLKKNNITILCWTINSKCVEMRLQGLADNFTFEQYNPDITDFEKR